MKKRPYRATPIRRVKRDDVEERVRGRKVVFGVDIAKEAMAGRLEVIGEEWGLNVVWSHPLETRDLVDWVASLPAGQIEVAMEPSGTYGDALRYQFEQAGIEVYRVSAKRSHDAAEVYDGVPSWHDVKSAGLVARLHREGLSGPWRERTEEEREMAALTRTMAMYDRQEESNLNRLEAQLARHWPELTHCLALTSTTLLELIKEFGSPQDVVRRPDAARSVMRRIGRQLLVEQKIEAVVVGAARTIGVPMTAAEAAASKELAEEILRNRVKGAAIRRKAMKALRGQPSAMAIAEVVGPRAAAAMVGAGIDTQRYPSACAVVKALGLNLKERSSGKRKGQLAITKRGPSDCRFYLYLAALRLIQRDARAGRWYARKVSRDGGRAKNKAVIAVMRKVASALWHVGRGAAFDSKLLFDVA